MINVRKMCVCMKKIVYKSFTFVWIIIIIFEYVLSNWGALDEAKKNINAFCEGIGKLTN